MDEMSLSSEFLKDPSSWIPSLQMELFLSRLMKDFSIDEHKLAEIAHHSPDLKTWGVLDSVLRIMPRTEEVWTQPEKILSYFVSPPPPVANVVRLTHSIAFDVPILSEQYPLSTFFLQSCFESIPKFSGREVAHVKWENMRVTVDWEPVELSLFDQEDPGFQVSPELMRQLVFSLESNQRELEERNAKLQQKNDLLQLQIDMQQKNSTQQNGQQPSGLQNGTGSFGSSKPPATSSLDQVASQELSTLRHQIGRLTDYMVRAQQLVSVLGSVDKTQKTFKDATRRLDWDFVKAQFPQAVEETYRILDTAAERTSHSIHH